MAEAGDREAAADALARSARLAIGQVDGYLSAIEGIPAYISLHSGLTYLRDDLRRAVDRYEQAKPPAGS